MRLVPVFLILCLVSVDAKFSFKNLFSRSPENKLDFGFVAEKFNKAVTELSTKIQALTDVLSAHIKPKRRGPISKPAITASSTPEFCRQYDCPRFYEVELNVTGDYKLRCYPKSYKWVSTIYDDDQRDVFMRLFRYISGNNQAEMKIKMTVPVAMKINTGPRSMSYQTMSFFIPFKHQQDAPMPKNDKVNLEIVKPFCAYVKVYGGFSTLSKVRENYQSLLRELREGGRGDDISDSIYSAGYDDPMKLFNRHNEVWIISKNNKPSENATVPDLPNTSSEPKPAKSTADEKLTEKTPQFCDENDCPLFYVKKNTTDFQLRCYNESYKWVSTSVANMNSKLAGKTAFWRLFRYIEGSNAKQMKIKMTVPVTMMMQPLQSGSGSFVKEDFTMSFFIPFKHQKDAPAPTADDVELNTVKPFCAYVREYGGFSNMEKVETHYKELLNALKLQGIDDFYTNMFYTAGYDAPYKLFNRRNEIWLISKSQNPVKGRILIQ